MTNSNNTRRIFTAMLREEWRLHSTLFGGTRFSLFPAVILLLSGGAAALLSVTGIAPETVFAGLHVLVLVFGIQTGTIGLVGRDTLQNLLGDLTLLVFSARTLPLSQSRLLAVFIVKDIVYYTLLFLLPMAAGTVAAINAVSGSLSVLGIASQLFLLWGTLSLTFVLGLGVTIAGLGLARRGVPGLGLVGVLAAAGGLAWSRGIVVSAWTPYGVFLTPSLRRIAMSLGVISAVFLVGASTVDVRQRRSARTVGPAFSTWCQRLGDPVATKTMLDIHRSSGGVLKVFFSAGILSGVTASLVDLAGQITGIEPSVGISFGTILGLTGFTTYNWLTQADSVGSYLIYPLTVEDIFDAKFRAFSLLGPAVGLVFYLIALLWYGGTVSEAVVGAILLVGVAVYIFGTTVYLTGMSPDEFLFDSALFAVFGVALLVPLVPILMVAFVLDPIPATLLAGLSLSGVGIGCLGYVLYRRSVPKWTRRDTQGDLDG
jgi:hypothetical protein